LKAAEKLGTDAQVKFEPRSVDSAPKLVSDQINIKGTEAEFVPLDSSLIESDHDKFKAD